MIEMFDSALQTKCGLRVDECGDDSGVYVYIDDGIFTGNRIRNDFSEWIKTDAPKKATVHIVVMALHLNGRRYAQGALNRELNAAGKEINFKWWRGVEVDDLRDSTYTSDVLRPTNIPDHELTQNYVDNRVHKPILRSPGNIGTNEFFSSEEGRDILEQEFLKAGVEIRSKSPSLIAYQRPLGNSVLETLGFGSLLVTFRNCPNNSPVAFWAGNPWHPLFPRSSNSETFMKRLLEN
jgi:hypothetical protein